MPRRLPAKVQAIVKAAVKQAFVSLLRDTEIWDVIDTVLEDELRGASVYLDFSEKGKAMIAVSVGDVHLTFPMSVYTSDYNDLPSLSNCQRDDVNEQLARVREVINDLEQEAAELVRCLSKPSREDQS